MRIIIGLRARVDHGRLSSRLGGSLGRLTSGSRRHGPELLSRTRRRAARLDGLPDVIRAQYASLDRFVPLAIRLCSSYPKLSHPRHGRQFLKGLRTEAVDPIIIRRHTEDHILYLGSFP